MAYVGRIHILKDLKKWWQVLFVYLADCDDLLTRFGNIKCASRNTRERGRERAREGEGTREKERKRKRERKREREKERERERS